MGKESLLKSSTSHVDDFISFDNKRLKEFISDIYAKGLTIFEIKESSSVASYLAFTRDEGNNFAVQQCDKLVEFGFQL